MYKHIIHPFEPIYHSNSKILILGTLPSVKSRENNFYYANNRNRFWSVLSAVLNQSVPVSIEEKKELLINNKIALWDVVKSCDIIGSSDSSIRNVEANNLKNIIEKSKITAIFANGKQAEFLYNKYQKNEINIDIISLPSTSPANMRYSFESLLAQWKKITDYMD